MMNGFDAAIILILIMGAVVGFKRGFTYEVVSTVGFFLVLILAYFLKNPLSVFLYEHLPFFKFGGIFKGVTVLNIFLYEVIAFLVVASILMFILKIIEKVTNLFEKFLKFTFVFSIPSKIAGMVVGIIESYVWVYIILYILNLPMFDISLLQKSQFKDTILNHTVILSNATNNSMKVINEFMDLKEKYEKLEELLNDKDVVAFIGDGINDAPSLKRADIGISMGSIGSSSAIEASDIVIMDDDISKINKAISISNKVKRIIKENLVFSIGVKILILVLSAIGIANMWQAVFADVGVTIISILNTLRIMKK